MAGGGRWTVDGPQWAVGQGSGWWCGPGRILNRQPVPPAAGAARQHRDRLTGRQTTRLRLSSASAAASAQRPLQLTVGYCRVASSCPGLLQTAPEGDSKCHPGTHPHCPWSMHAGESLLPGESSAGQLSVRAGSGRSAGEVSGPSDRRRPPPPPPPLQLGRSMPHPGGPSRETVVVHGPTEAGHGS